MNKEKSNIYFVNLEITVPDPFKAEIYHISIINANNEIILDSYVKPKFAESLHILKNRLDISEYELVNSADEINSLEKIINKTFEKATHIISYCTVDVLLQPLLKDNIASRLSIKGKMVQRRRTPMTPLDELPLDNLVGYDNSDLSDKNPIQNQKKIQTIVVAERFSIVYGEYEQGRPKTQPLSTAMDYYGINVCNVTDSIRKAAQTKALWETMYPSFYNDVIKEIKSK